MVEGGKALHLLQMVLCSNTRYCGVFPSFHIAIAKRHEKLSEVGGRKGDTVRLGGKEGERME